MNKVSVNVTDLSAFRLRSFANEVAHVTSVDMMRTTMKRLREAGTPFVILGGGSNSLFALHVDKVVVLLAMEGIAYAADTVTAQAGVGWDDFVLDTITHGYSGLEALSAIPGTVGAAPIQNIGAYGTEVSEHIETVTVYDIASDSFRSFSAEECGFGYRTSNFKTVWKDRYIVTEVVFALSTGPAKPVTYPGVAALLPQSEAVTALAVRNAVIEIRWSKLPKPELLPNVGSFFHNPIVTETAVQLLLEKFPSIPVFDYEKGFKKISAGWLIEQCGWKGKSLGPVGMYEKNALVMVNYGDATLDDVVRLQEVVQDSVREKFGLRLTREPSVVR